MTMRSGVGAAGPDGQLPAQFHVPGRAQRRKPLGGASQGSHQRNVQCESLWRCHIMSTVVFASKAGK